MRDESRVLDAVLDGVVVVDGQGRVAQLNAEACRMLETSGEKVAGWEVERLVGAEHPIAALTRSVLAERRPAIVDDLQLERRFDSDLEVDVAISPILDSADPGVVIAMRDHTVRNSLREREVQREQLNSYGHIAAGIAHEVKNPLGGIRGAAELLAGWSEDERAKGAAGLIVREVDRITGLVDELMVFARGDVLESQACNLHLVLDSVLDLLRMDPLSKGCEFERIYDPSIPDLTADADRLTQIFLNLGRNALQAMEGTGGALTLTTRMSLDDRITDRSGHQLPTVLVSISDTGPGIARDDLARLATPFYTTRPEGTGLGLAVARHWATRHNGTLRITSQLGEGTSVNVALPLDGPDATRRTA